MPTRTTSAPRSAPDKALQMLRIARPLHRDFGDGALDLMQILRGQLDCDGRDVLLEARKLRRAGNRRDPRLLGEKPSERDLRRSRLLAKRDLTETIDEGAVRLARLGREARHDVAEIVLVERRALVDGAREETFPERTERDKAYAKLFQRRYDFLLWLAPPQRIFALKRRHPLHRVRATDCLGAGLGKAEVLDLASADKVLHRARDIFDRHVRIDAVLIEKIDDVGFQPPERSLRHLPDVVRTAVEAALLPRVRIDVEAKLGRDDDALAERRERFAYDLFVRIWTVDFGGVEEGDVELSGPPNKLDCVLSVRGGAVAEAQPHAAETDG